MRFKAIKLYIILAAIVGAPFLIWSLLPMVLRDSVEVSLLLLSTGLVGALAYGERRMYKAHDAGQDL